MRIKELMPLGLSVCLCLVAATLSAGKVNAVRGKSYPLTKQHGPWLVLVASFRDGAKVDGEAKELSASEAAEELAFELRQKGMPAYTFSKGVEKGKETICVFAGNYPSEDDQIAKRTLKYIQKFTPSFTQDKGDGSAFRAMPGEQGPLEDAVLTANPMRGDRP